VLLLRRWANLAKPGQQLANITTNATAFIKSQLLPRRHLLADIPLDSISGNATPQQLKVAVPGQCSSAVSGPDQQCHQLPAGRLNNAQITASIDKRQRQYSQHSQLVVEQQLRQQQEESEKLAASSHGTSKQLSDTDWLHAMEAVHGVYRPSNRSNSRNNSRSQGSGLFALAVDPSGNLTAGFASDAAVASAVLLAGTSRQPAEYTLHQLKMSLLVLLVAILGTTVLQLLSIGLWNLLRLDKGKMPM